MFPISNLNWLFVFSCCLSFFKICMMERFIKYTDSYKVTTFGLISPFIACLFVQSPRHVRLCNPMDCSTPGFPVPRHLPEFAQVHVYSIGDAIQLSHPLSPSSPSTFNLSQHQGLFQ